MATWTRAPVALPDHWDVMDCSDCRKQTGIFRCSACFSFTCGDCAEYHADECLTVPDQETEDCPWRQVRLAFGQGVVAWLFRLAVR